MRLTRLPSMPGVVFVGHWNVKHINRPTADV
jgi:hypothetical protein